MMQYYSGLSTEVCSVTLQSLLIRECIRYILPNSSFRDTQLHSFQWVWEDGVKLLPNQQCNEDDSKLSKSDVMEYLHRLHPQR